MNLNHDDLRSMYQQQACLFLQSASKLWSDTSVLTQQNTTQTSSTTINITKTTTKGELLMLDPLSISRSLMIQSLYHPKHGINNTNTHNIQQQQLTGQQMEHEIVNVQESHRNNFWKLQKSIQLLHDNKNSNDIQKCNTLQQIATTLSSSLNTNPLLLVQNNTLPQSPPSTTSSKSTSTCTYTPNMSNDFICTTCGTPFLLSATSNSNNTTCIQLITLSRSKTRRRRASRYMAKKLRQDYQILQKHRGGGRSFLSPSHTNSPMTPSSSSSVAFTSHGNAVANHVSNKLSSKERYTMRRISDGLVKNAMQYKCCYCGQKTLWKGLKRPMKHNTHDSNSSSSHKKRSFTTVIQKNSSTEIQNPGRNCKYNHHPQTKSNTNQHPSELSSKQQLPSNDSSIDDIIAKNDDYLPLDPSLFKTPSSSLATASADGTTTARCNNHTSSLLLFNNSKQRKKKKKNSTPANQKKSSLMDFLSSLND